jgi:uncharacterized protein (TIGR03083 family)
LADELEVIGGEGLQILELARRDPDRAVPQYPEWTMADLLAHVGSILGRTTLVCLERPTERVSAPGVPKGEDPFDWYRSTLDEMIQTLGESDPDTPVWGFWPSSSIGLWGRRMVIETGVHRWDADRAFADPGPLIDPVALAGLEEYAAMWSPRLGEIPSLEVTATDLGKSWVYGSGTPRAEISGTASDIYLRLMSRPSPVVLPEDWGVAVDNLTPPPKP